MVAVCGCCGHQFRAAAYAGQSANLVLQFIHDAAGQFWSDAIGARDHRSVAAANGERQIGGFNRGQYRKPNFAANTLHARKQAEPVTFFAGGKADKAHVVFRHLHFGEDGGEIIRLA